MFKIPQFALAALAVFRKGQAVANPAAWKSTATATQTLVALLAALVGMLRVNGYELPVTDETLTQLAGGIAGLWLGGVGVYRVVTSPDRGLPAEGGADPEPAKSGKKK